MRNVGHGLNLCLLFGKLRHLKSPLRAASEMEKRSWTSPALKAWFRNSGVGYGQ